MTSRRRAALAAAGVLLLSGCTSFADTVADRPVPDAAPSRSPGTASPAGRAALPRRAGRARSRPAR